jgi:hypothetical protein
MRLKKGIYMDGHERGDVKEYQQNNFLSKMALFERRMAKWEPHSLRLECTTPDLRPGKKRVIIIFQDESLFHVNKYRQSIWCLSHGWPFEKLF